MALVCPSCGTENRTVAKFCIECIGALPTTFAPTEVAPLLHAPAPAHSEDMPSALIAFATTTPQRVAATSEPKPPKTVAQPVARQELQREQAAPPLAPRDKATETRKGLWVSVAAFGLALFVGAAGWMIAGAGGWYIYSAGASVEEGAGAGKAPVLPVAKAAMPSGVVALAASPSPAEAAVAPVTVQATAAPVQVAAADTVAASPPLSPLQVKAADAGSVASPSLSAVEMKSAKAPIAAANSHPAPAQGKGVGSARVVTAPHPNRKPSADTKSPESTQTALARCESLGFIAASRCKVEQCSKPQFQGRAECGPVLAQQRLMEQKRNPTMFN